MNSNAFTIFFINRLRESTAFVREYGGLEYDHTKAKKYTSRAQENLSIFPDSPAKESLMQFTQFVTARTK